MPISSRRNTALFRPIAEDTEVNVGDIARVKDSDVIYGMLDYDGVYHFTNKSGYADSFFFDTKMASMCGQCFRVICIRDNMIQLDTDIKNRLGEGYWFQHAFLEIEE